MVHLGSAVVVLEIAMCLLGLGAMSVPIVIKDLRTMFTLGQDLRTMPTLGQDLRTMPTLEQGLRTMPTLGQDQCLVEWIKF